MPDPVTRELRAADLSAAAFAPFGHLPADEGSEHDTADAEFLLDDGHINYIAHTAHEIGRGDRGLRCGLLNRHDTHTQTLMPMDADTVVVVAPADVDLTTSKDLESVRAFVVRKLECIHLNRGTWHWGPFPLDAPAVRVFNVQGSGYRDDNAVADLIGRHDVVFEILT